MMPKPGEAGSKAAGARVLRPTVLPGTLLLWWKARCEATLWEQHTRGGKQVATVQGLQTGTPGCSSDSVRPCCWDQRAAGGRGALTTARCALTTACCDLLASQGREATLSMALSRSSQASGSMRPTSREEAGNKQAYHVIKRCMRLNSAAACLHRRITL